VSSFGVVGKDRCIVRSRRLRKRMTAVAPLMTSKAPASATQMAKTIVAASANMADPARSRNEVSTGHGPNARSSAGRALVPRSGRSVNAIHFAA
jgi:hypothetical protein